MMLNIGNKRYATIEEMMDMYGHSKSYWSKLCHFRKVAYLKPTGRKVFIEVDSYESMMLDSRISTEAELEGKAALL